MSTDLTGLAQYRLAIARRILQRVTLADDFQLYTGSVLDTEGVASARHWNMIRALSSASNALLLSSDAAWTEVWKAIHVGPAAFLKAGIHTSWLTGAARSQINSRLQLVRRESNGQYSRVAILDAHLAARVPESSRPAFTAESFANDTTVQSAVEWLGIGHQDARRSANTPKEPLTFRARAADVPIGAAHAVNPTAYGGQPPYTFTVKSQPSPAVFTRNSAGEIMITLPSADYSAGDQVKAVIEVTDSALKQASGPVTITAKEAASAS